MKIVHGKKKARSKTADSEHICKFFTLKYWPLATFSSFGMLKNLNVDPFFKFVQLGEHCGLSLKNSLRYTYHIQVFFLN